MAWKYATDHWIVSSPAIWQDKLFIGSSDSYLYCLNKDTGSLIWKFKADQDIASTPAVDTLFSRIYFGSHNKTLYGIDIETGQALWKYSAGDIIYSSPALSNGRVFFGSPDSITGGWTTS